MKSLSAFLVAVIATLAFAGCKTTPDETQDPVIIDPPIVCDCDPCDCGDNDDCECADCAVPTPEFPDPLDAETARQIKQDYLDQFDTTGIIPIEYVSIIYYLGTYNGNTAMVFNSPLDTDFMIHEETVAGVTFYYSGSGFVILVWNDGEFMTLTQAYEQELLTLKNIRNISALHNFPFPYDMFTYELELKIKQIYFDRFGEPDFFVGQTVDDVEIRHNYGIYQSNPVVMFNPIGIVTDAIIHEKVAGFDFYYGNSGLVIWVCKNDELIKLAKAYEQGLLTQEDIKKIFALHKFYWYNLYAFFNR